ncbi:MAG: glycosyltransferase, partial [Thermoplasmata archaeon]
METLRFLMVTTFYPPYHIGGDAVHVQYLTQELIRQGHEVHVIFSKDAYRLKLAEPRGSKHAAETLEVIHPIETPGGLLSPARAYLVGFSNYIQKTFAELVSEVRPDVVHLHNISLLGHSLMRRVNRYLNLYSAHDYWLVCPRNNLMKFGRNVCESKLCAPCLATARRPPQLWRLSKALSRGVSDLDAIISPSIFLAERLRNELDVRTLIEHIPNFVPRPSDDLEDSVFDDDFFLYVGVLEAHKGVEGLVRLFLNKERPLVVAGGGSLENPLNRLVQRHGSEDRIRIVGRVSNRQLLGLYRNAEALITPSVWPEI